MKSFIFMVGMTGFEPATSWSRTRRSTKLSHIPEKAAFVNLTLYILSPE